MCFEKNKAPKIIDLFAGAGGLSLGAARAGFNVVVVAENDPFAIDTHQKNFPLTTHLDIDVLNLSGSDLLNAACLKEGELDGLIGGPPCQGFSTIGRQDEGDSRNNLFIHFFKLVEESRPKFFLAENVPGILSEKYDALRKEAFSHIPLNYVCLPPFKIAANEHGAPTTRTRVIFIGYNPDFFEEFRAEDFAFNPDTPTVCVRDALMGLPKKISPEWQKEEQGWRKLGKIPDSLFLNKISGDIPQGVGHQESIAKFRKGLVSGCLGTRHSDEVAKRYANVKQGASDKISKSKKLDPNGFCPTLRAGTGKDKGSYQAVRPLHPTQNRVITPREAARLQGFPDWFVFHKTKWHSFRQIGNSVSPIVAESLLNVIREKIKNNSIQEHTFLIEKWENHSTEKNIVPNVSTIQPL
jgi:DNA (cytosine-5)-methyltransferase 1